MKKHLSQILMIGFALGALTLFFILGLKGGTSSVKLGHVMPTKPVDVGVTQQAAQTLLRGLPAVPQAAQAKESLEDGLWKCLGLKLEGGVEVYVAGLIADPDVQHELLFENIHLQTTDGKQLRIQALGSSGDLQTRQFTDVRLFTVDADKLPIRAELPLALKGLRPAQQWTQLQKMGRPIYHQKREVFKKPDGLSITAEWRDGSLFEILWMGTRASFACSDSRCDCLNP